MRALRPFLRSRFPRVAFVPPLVRRNFLLHRASSDFGVVAECHRDLIFFLTSLFIDSRFQTVATNHRCESMNNGKGE
jgi:hypothetical protein